MTRRLFFVLASLTITGTTLGAQQPRSKVDANAVKVIRGSDRAGWAEDSAVWGPTPGLRRAAVDSGDVVETIAVQADTAWVTVWSRKQHADVIIRIQEERRLERRDGQWVRAQPTPQKPPTRNDTLAIRRPGQTDTVGRLVRTLATTVMDHWETRVERRAGKWVRVSRRRL
jgi:hypothetical protein